MWPPKGIEGLNPWEITFLTTVSLLTSGASVAWDHNEILAGQRSPTMLRLLVTILLASVLT